MKQFLLATLATMLAFPAFGADKHPSNVKRVATVAVYPFAHPLSFLKGGLYGALTVVGAAVDTIETVTASIARGAAKVDDAVDAAQAAAEPSPSPTPSPTPQQ